MKARKKFFSLIELLVVVGILGALCTLMLPSFEGAEDEAKEKVAKTELNEIVEAFRRFSTDVALKNSPDNMQNIVNYGLWPLMVKEGPANMENVPVYDDYDPEYDTGRRGPYVRYEGYKTVAATISDAGQPENTSGNVKIPVLKDPYGGYYRIMCPHIGDTDTGAEKKEKLRRMVIVYTGSNRVLETKDTEFKDPPHDNDIKALGDDIVVRLMPFATY